MFTTIRYILLTAIRDWLFIGLFFAMSLALGISYFLGGTALVEQLQMVVTYTAGSCRVILMTGLVVFVCFHVRRAFENREVEVMLTRPVTRNSFVLSYFLGFSLVATLLFLPLLAAMVILLPTLFKGALIWGLSILLEVYVVIAFSLACSLILRSAVSSVLVSFGFYFISRMMGFFTTILTKNMAGDFLSFNWFIKGFLESSGMLVLRLDLYGKSRWLIYGTDNDPNLWLWDVVPIFVAQSAVYIPLLLFMAMFDFRRRQF
jgi:ABC-type transport system involved in multi-copper enzyme maturation permease subunit